MLARSQRPFTPSDRFPGLIRLPRTDDKSSASMRCSGRADASRREHVLAPSPCAVLDRTRSGVTYLTIAVLRAHGCLCRCLAGSPASTSSYPEPSRGILIYLWDNAALLSDHAATCPESA